MSNKAFKITGWVLTGILALLFGMSTFLKLSQSDVAVEQAASIGVDYSTYWMIGIVELISLLLFIVPRTAIIGSLLLIAYMGGAIATHVQQHQPIIMAVIIQIILWITVAIRFPEVRQRIFAVVQRG